MLNRTIIPALVLALLLIGCGQKTEKTRADGNSGAAVGAGVRIVEQAPAESFTYDLANGEAIFDDYCSLCHRMGVAGAASHADKARWEESFAKGIPTLVEHAWNGYTGKYGVLPAKGGCDDCTKQDIVDAVHYHLVDSGVMNAE